MTSTCKYWTLTLFLTLTSFGFYGSPTYAQNGNIHTIVGSGLGSGITNPRQGVVDGSGNLLVADAGGNRVVRIGNPSSANPTFTLVAGVGSFGYSGDNGPAASASMRDPFGVAWCPNGEVFIADTGNNVIRRVTAGGTISTISLGALPALESPSSLACDSVNAVYIQDANGLRKWTPNGGAGVATSLVASNSIYSLAADPTDATNTIYWAGFGNNSGTVNKRANGGTGATTKIAGTDGACNFSNALNPCWSGAPGPALTTLLDFSPVLSVVGGFVYINSQLDNLMGRFKTDGTGNLVKIAGNSDNIAGGTGNGGLATSAGIGHYAVFALGVTSGVTPTVYFAGNANSPADSTYQPFRSFPLGGIVTQVNIPNNPNFGGDNGPAASSIISNSIKKVVFDAAGNMYFSDDGNNRVRKVSTAGVITTVAGNGNNGAVTTGGLATNTALDLANIAIDSAGFIYIANTTDNKIVRFQPGGNITLVATIPANLVDIAIDGSDNIYVVGNSYHTIYKYSTAGTLLATSYSNAAITISSIGVNSAGTIFMTDFEGAGLSQTALRQITGASTTNLLTNLTNIGVQFIANYPVTGNPFPGGGASYMDNLALKRFNSSNSAITTIAGTAGTSGFAGDGGPATSSVLSSALAISYDKYCNGYVSDSSNQRIRKIDNLVNATVSTAPSGASITVDGVSGTGGVFNNWISGSSHSLTVTSPQTPSAGTKYIFLNWSPDNSVGLTDSVIPACVNPTYTANFKTQYQLTTQVSPAAGGSATPGAPTFFDSTATPQIQATANQGYQFVSWSLTTPGTATIAQTNQATTTVTQTAPTTVQANFAPADGAGTMTVAPSSALAGGNRSFTFTYTAGSAGMSSGEVDLVIPAGWTSPTTSNVTINGVAASAGNISGNTIKATGVTLTSGATMAIGYNSVTVTNTVGSSSFTTQQKAISSSSLTGIGTSPSVSVVGTATWSGATSSAWNIASNWTLGSVPTAGNSVTIPTVGVSNQPNLSTVDATVANLTLSAGDSLTIAGGHTMLVNGILTMNGNNIDATGGTLEIGANGTISRTSGVVLGSLKKDFLNGAIPPPPGDGIADVNAPDAPDALFTFPVGTSTGYFPVDVTPTGGSTGSLTIQTFNGTAGAVPPLDNTKTLQRYWTVSGGAGITASIKFNYGPINVGNGTAINGNEANYKPQRVTAGVPTSFFDNCPAGTCVDQTNHFIFMPVVSNASFAGNWTASEIAPTAAPVAVAGRVLTADGQAIRGVRITLDDSTGHAMTAISNAFGYYSFSEVQSGGTYIMNATARGYTFTPRVVSVNDQLTDVNLTALP